MNIEVFSAVGAGLTALGLFYAGRQFQLSRQLAKHQFMLQLFEKMDVHNDLHERVTEISNSNDEWPKSRKDWIQIGRLLGLYEHIGNLVDDRIITVEQADASFSYRLVPILKIEKVNAMLYSSDSAWKSLRKLIIRLETQKLYQALSNEKLERPK